MKKLTKSLLAMTFAATMVSAAACGENASDAWKNPTYTDHGAVATQTLGGFVAETEKYAYFINGVGSNSSDNTFGTPIKGALVAVPKNDLTKAAQVVVPELFVASDYNAGVYLFGSGAEIYAYYGTPNKEKDSSGEVARSEMTFSRTRLDGTKNEKLFTVSSLSTEYRMAEVNGTVYIVYYDSAESALVSYNCTSKTKEIIAKTDAETNDKKDGEYLSLDSYKFLDSGSAAEVIYTLTVYSEPYYAEKKEDDSSYSRATRSYNYLMAYKAGSSATKIKDGKNGDKTYAVSEYVSGYVFYTETPISGDAVTYAVKDTALQNATEIVYTDNVKSDMIIKGLDEVYFYDSGKVVKTVLTEASGTEYDKKQTIVKDDGISTLIDVDANYVYATDSDGYIVAIERNGDERTIKISERTASSSWYAAEIISVSSGKYMLFCDNSGVGNSYVYYADLNKLSAPIEKDTDDDGTADEYYLGNKFVGVMPAADRAVSAESVVGDIVESYKEDDNGAAFKASVKAARDAYEALDGDAKAAYSSDKLTTITNAENAVKLGDAYIKLAKIINYNKMTDAEKETLKTDFNAAKALKEKYENDGVYEKVAAYLVGNLKYYYQATNEKLNPSK